MKKENTDDVSFEFFENRFIRETIDISDLIQDFEYRKQLADFKERPNNGGITISIPISKEGFPIPPSNVTNIDPRKIEFIEFLKIRLENESHEISSHIEKKYLSITTKEGQKTFLTSIDKKLKFLISSYTSTEIEELAFFNQLLDLQNKFSKRFEEDLAQLTEEENESDIPLDKKIKTSFSRVELVAFFFLLIESGILDKSTRPYKIANVLQKYFAYSKEDQSKALTGIQDLFSKIKSDPENYEFAFNSVRNRLKEMLFQ
jgi:hypothetical protein